MAAADIRLTSTLHLLEPIRDWGSNATWLGYDESQCEAVAVQLGFEDSTEKQLDAWQRFREYATGPARVASPRIARVNDCSVADDGRLYVVSERLRGASLGRRLANGSPLELHEVGALLQQVAQALSVVHQRGFVHGGLSADNVVLLHSDRLFVKLVEVGQWGRRRPMLIADHAPRCAHGYLAPEQVSRDSTVDERTDVWALGVLAYHALTGQLPFQGATLAALILAIVDSPCPPRLRPGRGPLRVVAHRLDAWFRRALHKAPEQRFASVEDAVAAWRDAAAADHHDRDFAVDRVSFHRQLGNDTVTNIAPWLLQGASSDDDDDDMYDAETETDEVTTLYVSVDVEPHDSDVRALLDGVRFEEVG